MCYSFYMMKNTSDPKGIPAVLQNHNGSFRVRVTRYNETYATVVGIDETFTNNGYESTEIVLTKDLVFLNNLI